MHHILTTEPLKPIFIQKYRSQSAFLFSYIKHTKKKTPKCVQRKNAKKLLQHDMGLTRTVRINAFATTGNGGGGKGGTSS